MKLNFVAIASHELRTPAAAVYGALATIVNRTQLPFDTREQLVVMAYEQSDRLRRLIEQLLDLSRLDARSIPVSPRPIVVGGVLESIVSGAVPDGPDVELGVPEDLAAVADPVVLDRILTNQLTN
jgi:signal transduction histidine kinase